MCWPLLLWFPYQNANMHLLVIAVAFLAVYCTTKVEASVLRAFRNWKADKFTSFFNLFILLQEYVFVTADENENSLK